MLTDKLYEVLRHLSNVGAGLYGSALYGPTTTRSINGAEQEGLVSVDRRDTKNKKKWVVTITPKGRAVLNHHRTKVASAQAQTHVERMTGFGTCVLCGQMPEETSSFGGLRCSNPNCSLRAATIPIPAWKKLSEVFKEAQKTTVGLGLYTKSLEGL